MTSMTNEGKPKVRSEWTDFNGRTLKVTKVDDGRVYGRITYCPTGHPRSERTDDYSCDAAIFKHIWEDKNPPADPIKMLHKGVS